MTVVGVAGRVRQYTLDGGDPRIAMYLWHRQRPSRALNVVVRTTAPDPTAIAPQVRQQIRELDADLPVYNVRTMEQRVEESLARRRFAMTLLTLFALLALGLAAIGTYGVIAYLVSQGTRDIGIRLALGATPANVVGMVVKAGMFVVAAGIVVGLAVAWMATRFIQTLLFNVTPTDAVTFASITILLAAIAFAATYAPARRAARVDPLAALRSE
jgi:ABC-type antimicrobial peptide transport system permease subunit